MKRQLTFPCQVAFNSVAAQITAAVCGAGIVQTMDLLLAEGLASGKLAVLLPEWSAPGAPVSVVWRSALRDSPKIRVFADFAADGHAWTAAYTFNASAHWRFTLEWLRVVSSSYNHQGVGGRLLATETQPQLAIRYALGSTSR